MEAKYIKRYLLGIGASLMLRAPAFTDQPFDTAFDWRNPVTLTGTVTKVEWTNWNVQASIDVRDVSGRVTSWTLEFGAPRTRGTNYGRNDDLLKAGDRIAVDGWLASNGQKRVSVQSVTLNDGREFLTPSMLADLLGRCISDELCFDGESNAQSTVGQSPSSDREP